MKPFAIVFAILSAFVLSANAADTFKVDSVHSFVLFGVQHLGFTNTYGRFNDISGTVVFDKDNPSKSSVELSVPVESLDTNNSKRDQSLKTPDFFDAKQFPTDDPMQLLKQMPPSAALAAAVAAALLFIFACWWRSVSRCAGAIAIGAGYLAGHVLAAGWSPLPPRHAIHWLFWFAVIGVIAAAADAFVRPKRMVRLVTWAIICTIACRLILQPKFSYAWSAAEGWLRVFA